MRRNRHTFVWVAVSIAMLLATLSGTVSAQTYTWIGGSRTWDTSSLNWNGGTVAWPTTGTNNDALFGSTSGATTITIQSGGVTANDLQFSGTAYTLTGGTLTLNGATPTITLTPASSGFTAQIGSTLAGSNGFGVTSSGGGVLELTGSNSVSGAIAVSGSGTSLILNNSNAVSNASSLSLGADTQLRPGGNIESGTVRINNLTGAGTINANYGGSLSANIVRTIDINTTTDGIFSGRIDDGGGQRLIGLVKSGTATLTLSGTNTYTGSTIVAGGVLGLSGGNAIANSATVTINNVAGATLRLNADETIGSIGVQTSGQTNGTVDVGVYTLTLSAQTATGAVAATQLYGLTGSGRLIMSGAGELFLTGGNSGFTGTITGSQGIVALGSPSAGNNQMKVLLTGSGALRLGAGVVNTSVTIGELTGSANTHVSPQYGGTGGTKILVVDQSTTTEFAGRFNRDTGNSRFLALTKSGTGTLTLSGSNEYAGTTTLTAGVLRLNSDNALPGGIGSTISGSMSSALTINGGVIGLGSGNFARALGTGTTQVQITGGGGFAAYGADRTVNFGGNVTPTSLTWGSGNFISAGSGTGTFVLGAADATAMVTFQNPIALGSAVRTVQVDNGSAAVDATLSGVLSSVSAGNGLTKTGAGTLDLTAENSFNGTLAVQNGTVRFSSLAATTTAQNLGAGTLVNLGVAATSAGEIDYRGSGGTLSKNITALGSGRNRIRNSGGGTLTLSGTLTKDGTILELASGTFDVSGRITGATVGTSDLFVNAAAVTLSNTNNDYNGPTYVYGGGSLTLGASNVIPANSSLILGGTGSDTGTGTFNTGLFSDTVLSLTTGSLGATIGITGSGATMGGLTTTGNVTFGAGTDTLNLSLSGSLTLGNYKLLTYQGTRSGTFDTVNITNPDSRYTLVYGGASNSSIDLQMKANQATTFTMTTGTVTRALVNTNVTVSGTVSNSSPTDAAALTLGLASTGLSGSGFTTGSVSAASNLAVSGLLNTGAVAGTQNWSITNTDNNAITTVSTANGSIEVFDPALPSWTSSTASDAAWVIDLGERNQGSGSYSENFSIWNLVQTAGYTADLDLISITPDGLNSAAIFTDLAAFNGLVSGSSNQFVASMSLANLGNFSNTWTLAFKSSKDGSQFNDSPRNLTLTVTGIIVVPEPGALALAGIGIAAAAWGYRRRRS